MKKLLLALAISLSLFLIPQVIFAQGLGTITPPAGIPTTGADPSAFVAGIIRAFIQFLLITAFIIGLIWMIFAGYSFIFAGGDPKNISSAWSRIYWGLLGLVVVVGAFAIIKLVETAFNVTIISGGFQLPQRE